MDKYPILTSCMNIGLRTGTASSPPPVETNQPPATPSSAALQQDSASPSAFSQASTAAGRGRQQQLLQSQQHQWSIEKALAVPGQKALELVPRVQAVLTPEKLADLMADLGNKDCSALTPEQMRKIAKNPYSAETLGWLRRKRIQSLMRNGFITEQIATIASNNGGKGVLEWLAEPDNLAKLTHDGDGNPLFTTDQITAIASNHGGKGVLEWLAEPDNLAKLTHDDDGKPLFSTAQIATIAGKGGALKTLKDIAAKHWKGVLDKDEVVKLTSANSGSLNLTWVLQHKDVLLATGPLRNTFLAQARSKVKGAKDKALALFDAAANPSSSSKRMNISLRTGTASPLPPVEANQPPAAPSSAAQQQNSASPSTFLQASTTAKRRRQQQLLQSQQHQLSIEKALAVPGQEPLKLAPRVQAVLTPEKLTDLMADLGNKDCSALTPEQMRKIAKNPYSAETFGWLTRERIQRLMRNGFTTAQITTIAGKSGARSVLAWLANPGNLAKLTHDGNGNPLFTTAQIATISSKKGARSVLEWLAEPDYLAKLTHDGNGNPLFITDQIATISSNDGACSVLEWLVEPDNLAKLSHDDDGKPLFTTDQITAIAGKNGAIKTLKDIAAKHWKGVLDKDEVVKLTSASSGSLNLAWVLQHKDLLPAAGPLRDTILALARSTAKGAKDNALALLQGTGDAAASSSSSGKRKKSAASQGTGPAKRAKTKAPVIKTEPSEPAWNFPSSAMEEGMETVQLNTAQLLHVPVMRRAVIEVDADGGHKVVADIVRRDMDNAVIENHRQQIYDRDLEKRFPIRDPANPEHVHPLYAHPDDPTRAAPQVAIEDVLLYKATLSQISEGTFWQHAQNDKTPYPTKALYIAALKRSIMAEVQATIEGREPPSCKSIVIQSIDHPDQCDGLEEYQATKGQYGAFLTNYAKDQQPTLRNARIGCLFAGAKLASDADDVAYLNRTGSEFGLRMLSEYAANRNVYGKKEHITWAPHGGGNMGQYFNTSFKKKTIDGEDFLVCDEEKVTAMLAPITLTLTDKEGMERAESMLGIFLTKTIEEGKQPKLDYGADYKIRCKGDQPEAMQIDHPPKTETT